MRRSNRHAIAIVCACAFHSVEVLEQRTLLAATGVLYDEQDPVYIDFTLQNSSPIVIQNQNLSTGQSDWLNYSRSGNHGYSYFNPYYNLGIPEDGNYESILTETDTGEESKLSFFHFDGDFNRDRAITQADLDIVSTHMGDGHFSQGDYDYGSYVDYYDYDLTSARVGLTLPAPLTAAGQISSRALNSSSQEVSWKPVLNAQRYRIFRSEAGALFGQIAEVDYTSTNNALVASNTTLTWNDTGLPEGKKYYYRIRPWTSASGEGATTAKVFSATQLIPPSDMEFSDIKDHSLTLNWEDHSSVETSYVVQVSTGGAFTNFGSPLPANSTTLTATGLSENTSYTWRVYAKNNDAESGTTTPETATTKHSPDGTLNIRDDKTGGGIDAYTVTGVHADFSSTSDPEGSTDPLHYSFALSEAGLATSYASASTSASTATNLDVTQRGSKTVWGRIFTSDGRTSTVSAACTVIDNDPVIVLNEVISKEPGTNGVDAFDYVEPYLWHNPLEFHYDPRDWRNEPWNNIDGDQNTYKDDAYGWNFSSAHGGQINSPNFQTEEDYPHGRIVTGRTVEALNRAGVDASHVKIMYVIGQLNANSAALNYILWHKTHGVNIVAIGEQGPPSNRAGAELLNNAGIMLIGGNSNSPTQNQDTNAGNLTESFWSAMPRPGIELPPLDNVIPVCTDPDNALTAYGINSFLFGVPGPGVGEQSYAGPAAAAMVGAMVKNYLAKPESNNVNPTVQQIKRAMMSGVNYKTSLGAFEVSPNVVYPGRTITHDYSNGRTGGGVLSQSRMIEAINDDSTPEVSIEVVGLTNLASNTVQFNLIDNSGTVNDWTISWGDNQVQVWPSSLGAVITHPYTTSTYHTYYPTVYANFGTGSSRKVSFASTAEVSVGSLVPTTGKDDWVLERSGDTVKLSVTNSAGTFSKSVIAGNLGSLPIELGEGGDTLTVDYTGGDPIGTGTLSVTGASNAGNTLTAIGTPTADNIAIGSVASLTRTISIDSSQFTVSSNVLKIALRGGAGNDTLTGNDGDDTLDGGTGSDILDGGAGTDTVTYGRADGAVTVSAGDGGNDGVYGELDDVKNSIEIVSGGAGNDVITLASGGLRLLGGDGNDSLTGSGGNDSIHGGAGRDTIHGGDGNDLLYANAGILSTPPADDEVYGDAGNDTIEADRGNQTVDGGSGNDVIYGGSEGTKILNGGDGNDALYAALYTGSISYMNGGNGDDVLEVGVNAPANNILHGDAGDDHILIEGNNPQRVYGDSGDDQIQGAGGSETIDGGAGDDSIHGGGGNDVIHGDEGTDTITGGTGNDALFGDDDNDLIAAEDTVRDTIDGGNGTDSLQSADYDFIIALTENEDIWSNIELYPGEWPPTSLE